MEPYRGERRFLASSEGIGQRRRGSWLAVGVGFFLMSAAGIWAYTSDQYYTSMGDYYADGNVATNAQAFWLSVLGGITLIGGLITLIAGPTSKFARSAYRAFASIPHASTSLGKDDWFKVAAIAAILIGSAAIAISLHWK